MEISDKYKIVNPLGNHQGRKFGSLFLVEDKSTGERGVMKVVPKSNQTAVAVERLQGEASFDFDVAGLPKILDFYDGENEVILIRNYIDAEPILDRYSTTKKRERHIFLCETLKKLGILLDHLHKQSIYHCDIKPGNILLDAKGNVHLIDFGLAIQQPIAQTRKLLFPLGYAAPELLLNHLSLVDHRTDYFALGITMWRLYSGKLPLAHANPSIFTNLQLTHPLPESDEIRRSMQQILAKMCAKHSFKVPPNSMPQDEVAIKLKEGMDQRYSSYNNFLRDFQEAGNKGLFTKRYPGDNQG
ncbi:MAG: protein kinase [bacterium]|nr:protein kinase [bacterium]